ncbi:DUF1624 domain-containing protein [Chitinophagaceae bacterium LWZ2-11]
MKRSNAIDFARGLVMIIMALDHTRDLVCSITQNPTDLATTTPLLFFTRWITHLCAPIFVFLSGSSAYLSFSKEKNVPASRRFLLSRGIWLLILECTVVNFGIFFDLHFRTMFLQVIFAIGASFIVLSLLLKLSPKTIGIIGLVIVLGHNVFDYVTFPNTIAGNLLSSLVNPVFKPVNESFMFVLMYPVIPWLGIMLIGFACGQFFKEQPVEKRKKVFITAGASILTFFIILRFINVYGDPAKWSMQKDAVYTFLSFMNVTKYAPSLLYTSATLGIMCFILYWGEVFSNKITTIISVYGKVPMFYYLIHWYILHTTMLCMMFIQGYKWDQLDFGIFGFGKPKGITAGVGVGLGGTYIIWMSVVIVLYPLCKRYSVYKDKHRENKWLRYL